MYGCFGCMLCVCLVLIAPEESVGLDSMELELQMVVSVHVGAGKQT